jgi:hypothetical protein
MRLSECCSMTNPKDCKGKEKCGHPESPAKHKSSSKRHRPHVQYYNIIDTWGKKVFLLALGV